MSGRQFDIRDGFGRPRSMGLGLSDDNRDILIASPLGEGMIVDPVNLPGIIEELLRLQSLAFANRTGRRPS